MRYMRRNRFAAFLKPFMTVLLAFSVFGLIWLRSSVVSLEYKINDLEKKRDAMTIQRKLYAAERAKLLSVERFEKASVSGSGFGFPDRVKVVYVKKMSGNEQRKTSYLR